MWQHVLMGKTPHKINVENQAAFDYKEIYLLHEYNLYILIFCSIMITLHYSKEYPQSQNNQLE